MYNPLLLPDLRQMLEENDLPGLREFCAALHPAVAAEVLEGLPGTDAWKVLANTSLERQVEIFEFITLPKQVELVDNVDRERLSKLVEAMAPDDRVDLLSRMDPEHVESLLPLIAQAQRNDIRKLLSYPDASAGSIMTTEYASLPEDITVAEALDRLRLQAPHRETIYYVYILDEDRRLKGMLSLADLILARPDTKLTKIKTKEVISVNVTEDREQVAQTIAKYDFIAIPVVDGQGHLVGIVTHDDVLDVVQEEANEDAYKLGAVAPLEDSYLETPLPIIFWKRGIWLVLLGCFSLITAGVMKSYESGSEQYAWMVFFLPLVLSSGGNTGSQSCTLIIRAIALGGIARRESMRLARRELIVGIMLGSCMALLGFTAMQLFFSLSLPRSAVVGGAIFVVVTLGSVVGAVLPLIFKHLGMDPAVMSNPLIAALSDFVAVVVYYTVAVLILEWLIW